MRQFIFLFGGSIVLFLFLLPQTVFGAVSYSRSPIGGSVSSPVTFNVSFDNFSETGCNPGEYWSVAIGAINAFNDPNDKYGKAVASAELSHKFSLGLSATDYYNVVVICSTDETINNSDKFTLDLEGDGSYKIFTITVGAVTAVRVYTPEINLSESLIDKTVSGVLNIKYEATDADDKKFPDHGLKKINPVSFYYQPVLFGSFDWKPIVLDLASSGVIAWDTTKLPDGDYRFRATAAGADGDLGQLSFPLKIDNTPPNFTVKIFPNFTKGEPVDIGIESSEILKSNPILAIRQLNHEIVTTTLTGDKSLRKFNGVYEPVSGFDGLAEIKIQGEDPAGNKGQSIIGDEGFNIGFKPPSKPVIEDFRDGIRIQDTFLPSISGYGVNAEKITLKVNGKKERILENLKKGRFNFKNIELDPSAEGGRNILSLVSYDKVGALSEAAKLVVVVNAPPELTFIEPRGRAARLNGIVNFHWRATDFNGDALTFTVELSDDRGNSWRTIAKDLKVSEYAWDSTQVPDSSNYLVRITASDGEKKTQVSTNRLTIENDLPAIVLEESGEIFTNKSSMTIRGFVRSKNDLISKLELTVDEGKNWKELNPEDGKWNSVFERFNFEITSAKKKAKRVILRGTAKSGQIVVNAQNLKIFFDNKTPTLVVENLPAGMNNKNLLSINGVARDDFSGIESVEYSIDDSKWFEANIFRGIASGFAEFVIEHPERLKDGEHGIKIRVIDRAGNISGIKLQKTIIDATPPRIGSFILSVGGKMVFPVKNRTFEIPKSKNIALKVAIAGKPKEAKLFLNGSEIEIRQTGKLWVSSFVAGDGESKLVLSSEDGIGNKVEKEIGRIIAN